MAKVKPGNPQILKSLRDEYIHWYGEIEVVNNAVLEALTADKDTQVDDLDKQEVNTNTIESEHISNLCEVKKKLRLKDTGDIPVVVDKMRSDIVKMSNNLFNMAESMNRPLVNITHFSGGHFWRIRGSRA